MTLSASSLSPEASVNPLRFHGIDPPRIVIQEEQPYHRQAAFAFATFPGVGTAEVAEMLGVTTGAVRLWLQQPWFQERIAQLAEQHGRTFDIVQLFKAEAMNSLNVLVEIRDSGKTSAQARIKSAVEILDRGMGKPVQRIETTNHEAVSSDPVAEVERLEQENQNFRL